MGHLIVSDVGRAEAKHTHVGVPGSLFGKDIKPRGHQGRSYPLNARSQCRFPRRIGEKTPHGKRNYRFLGASVKVRGSQPSKTIVVRYS